MGKSSCKCKYIPAEIQRFSVQSVLEKLQTGTTWDFIAQTGKILVERGLIITVSEAKT